MRAPALVLAAVLALRLPAAAEDAEKLFSAGQQAYAAEDYERAVSWFEQAVQIQPSVSLYHLWLGRACGRRAERVFFTRAIGLAKRTGAAFQKAVELDGSSIEALNDLLDFYLQAPGMVGGGEEKAPPLAARLARLSPAEGHRAQSLMLANKKDWAGAEAELRRALDIEPSKPGRLLELASFLSERGRAAEADALFDRAAGLAPDSPEYLFARGRHLVESKRNPETARQLLEQYLQSPRRPDDPPPSQVKALLKKLG